MWEDGKGGDDGLMVELRRLEKAVEDGRVR